MNAYIFKAALWCEDCIAFVKAEAVNPTPVDESDESSYDSDYWPKGPYANGGGEADTPQHCDGCGVFLENDLTPDGADYVREAAKPFQTHGDMSWPEIADAARAGNQPMLAVWIDFYMSAGL